MLPSDGVLSEHIRAILENRDLSTMSLKEVRGELETRLSQPRGALDEHKDKIKELATVEIGRIQAAQEQAEAQQEAGEEAGGEAAAAEDAPSKRRDKKRKSQGGEPSEKKRKEGEEKPKLGGAKERQADAMTRKEFMKHAKAMKVPINGKSVTVPTKQFSTNSCGWWGMSKVPIEVNGVELVVQCQINCAVIGSKEWKD
eukprot:gnl/TRDRNA2_/TRDRNA2_192269_c0_seq1.p1 gnl/TRDRNA2_/TRDRNA2_192269_c0~~gnl/TRDRNA2_/TRDRNA2_192269_c0_seq1.p1  ORF type:complete len:199 (-),score=58.85 gnl/TRDRNA2_/TRDRNA2_192269_c0_seq1:99-695(-)